MHAKVMRLDSGEVPGASVTEIELLDSNAKTPAKAGHSSTVLRRQLCSPLMVIAHPQLKILREYKLCIEDDMPH